MRIPRIYIEQVLVENSSYQLPVDAAQHVGRVLRMEVGQSLYLFDGRGGYFDAIISRIQNRIVEVVTGSHHTDECESPLIITLIQGVSRGERMDYTLQKAVELGVHNIVPVLCQNTSVKLDDEKKQKRHEHWSKIIINACEQCGRNRLPALAHTRDLDKYIDVATGDLKLILHPDATMQLHQLKNKPVNVSLLAGPEGGFSESEVTLAMKHGYHAINIGPRILRTETAALAAITACQVLWGDLH